MRTIVFLFLSFFTVSYYFGQNGNLEKWDQLIKKEQFDQLKVEFQQKDKSEYSYINFLRTKALNYSLNKEDNVAVNIMKHCCDLANNKFDDCDTVKLNNLHLLGRYYLNSNELDRSLEINQYCLKKRLSCENVNPIDLAKSYNNIGLNFQNRKDLDSSLYYFEKALKHIKKEDFNVSAFPNIIYRNYLLNLTFKGEIKQSERLIKKWIQYTSKKEDYLFISKAINRNIYEYLVAKNIKGAYRLHAINEGILIKLFGEKSKELFEYRSDFAADLSKQDFDEEGLNYIKKIVKKHIKELPKYDQFVAKSILGLTLMNMGFNEEALKIYLELKPQFLKDYSDSSNSMVLLSNLSICYKKLGQIELMKSTRDDLLERIEKNYSNSNFYWIYEKTIDRKLNYLFENEDFENYELTLNRSIKFYNKIGEKDRELHDKLKLSNLFLFQKPDFTTSKKLLDEVKKDIYLCIDQSLINAYYNYYYAEFLRRNGYQNDITYYKEAFDIFDSIGFYPIEYENCLRRHAGQLLSQGNFEKGKMLLNKYLELGTKDLNSITYFDYQINYLKMIQDYQSDELNDKSTRILLDNIEKIYGINNSSYRKAAKFLNGLIIDYNAQKKVITNWVNSFDSKNNLDYYFAKSALTDFYFENGEHSKCDSIGEIMLKESEILKIEDYKVVAGLYIKNVTFNLQKGFKKSISLLDSIGNGLNDFEKDENRYYFYCLMGLKDYSSVINYLNKKEEFILSNYTENSEPYFLLINDFITYYQTIGNANLEKYFREKELDLYYKYQPDNKSDILFKTVSLGLSYGANFNVYDYTENLINKVKSKFTIDIENTEDINELFFVFLEIYCNWGKLMTGDQSVKIIQIQNDALKLQNKCISLKSIGHSKFNSFMIDYLIACTKYFQDWDGSLEQLNNKSASFFEFFKENDLKNQAQQIPGTDLSEFEIRTLIKEGKTDEAEKLAFSKNNFLLLSEIEYEKDNIVKSFDYSCMNHQQNLDKTILNSNSLSEIQLEESRRTQKNFLNFSLNKYLLNLANYDSKSNMSGNFKIMKKSFELIVNNYGVLSKINKDLYSYLRNSDSVFRSQYYSLSKYNNQKLLNKGEASLSNETIREIEYKINLKMFDREPINPTWVTFEDIKKSLDDSTAFVLNYKFVYNGFDESLDKPKTETYYLTFIVESSGYSPTVLIDSLSIENEADIVDYYHSGITKKGEKQDLSFIYDKIWAKIDEELPKKVKRVILSPDGMYNSINVSTLFDKNNNKYIFDKYEIIIADKIGAENNTNLSQLSSSINSAVLVGFPNYSGTTISDKQNTNDTLKLNLDKYYSNVTRGSIAKSLPGTKTEIEKINSQFVNNGIKTTVLMENNATEDNLKKVVSPDVLHIATHGFFINSKEGTPMLNSGLLLAGSNSKTKKIEDGYLSAYETSLLNLENTKLVVLSACETGRGVMKDGDGVFGLKQGCLNAGAQNIIMSLWKVDDKVTQEFMSRFYEIWLNDRTSIREAFNKTQLEIKAKYPQPYYWGAFILVGE